MGKKRSSRFVEEQRKKKKQQEDSLLEVGLANNYSGGLDEDVYDDHSKAQTRRSHKRETFENEEQDYELKPRILEDQVEEVEALPIKKGSKVERIVKKVVRKQEKEESDDDEDDDEEAKNQKKSQAQNQEASEESEVEVDSEEAIAKLKEEIADLVERLQEEPEEHIDALTRLVRMAKSKNKNTSRFSLLAIVPALKAIIPGYRIRPLSDMEKREKVSKDVQKLRYFEQKLVANYKSYIDLLTNLNSNSVKEPLMGQLAVKATCELASSFHGFNYRSDVLIILIRRICRPGYKNDPLFQQCIKTLEVLLTEDNEGDLSFDIVRLLTKTIRSRNFRIDESVLNIFLSIRILSDYDPNATEEERKERIKMRKKDRVHLSKKERKQRKERKEIEEELRKAEQKVSEEEREKYQGQILKLLITMYLELLKLRPTELIAALLEGLSKVGHMVNFELLGDFLEVIKEIIKELVLRENLTNLEIRQILLSIATAFTLISNHSQYKVTMDLSGFIESLYTILYQLSVNPDIEFSYKSLRLADPLESQFFVKPSVNISTEIELLLRALESIFFRSKNGTKQRALAFTKRLFMSALQTPEKSSIAILKFIDKLMNRHDEINGLFSTEDRILNGKFNFEQNTPNRCNPDAATIYEILLLEKHFSPTVMKGAKAILHRTRESANK